MMKKLFLALLLAVVVASFGTGALAATDVVIETGLPEFDLRLTAEQDFEVQTIPVDGACLVVFGEGESEDPNQIQYIATIAVSDDTTFDGANLSDATPEQLENFFTMITMPDDGYQPYTYKITDMDDGVRAMTIIDETLRDEAWTLTIKDGVFIQVFASYPDFHAVSDEVLDNTAKLLDAFQFIDKQAAE